MIHIRSAEYVIFDVETTGLSARDGDRILEIAAVKTKNFKIIDRFESLVNPQRSLSQEVVEIHGISEDILKNAPAADEVLPRMIDFIGGACLVGHNVRFDLGFLCYELAGAGRKLRQDTPVLDTLKLAKDLLPYLSSYRLSSVALALGIIVQETHRAMADVELTATVYERLVAIAADRELVDLHKFLEQFGVEKPAFALPQASQGMLF